VLGRSFCHLQLTSEAYYVAAVAPFFSLLTHASGTNPRAVGIKVLKKLFGTRDTDRIE